MCVHLLFILNWFNDDLLQLLFNKSLYKIKKKIEINESSEGTYAFWMYRGNEVIKLCPYYNIMLKFLVPLRAV